MFRQAIALDIGSRSTKIAVKNKKSTFRPNREVFDGIYSEASCIAAQKGLKGEYLFGNEALDSYAELAFPVQEGAAANSRLLTVFIRRLCAKYCEGRSISKLELNIAMSKSLGVMKNRNLQRALETTGAKSIAFHDASLMAAIGAGMDIMSENASMLVNIGAETLRTAVVANGGVLFESCIGGAGNSVTRELIQLFKNKYGLVIGSGMAEEIKLNLSRPAFVVDGRDLFTGMPRTITAYHDEVASVTDAMADEVTECIIDAVKALQVDAAADIADTGIMLVGGGAKLYGLEEKLRAKLKLPVTLAENAETAVIDGMNSCIFEDNRGICSWNIGYALEEVIAE